MFHLKLTYQCVKCGNPFEVRSHHQTIQCDCGHTYYALHEYYDDELRMLPPAVTSLVVEDGECPST